MNRSQAVSNIRKRKPVTPPTRSQPSRSAKKSAGTKTTPAATTTASETPRRTAVSPSQVRKRAPPVEAATIIRNQLDRIDQYESSEEEEEEESEDSVNLTQPFVPTAGRVVETHHRSRSPPREYLLEEEDGSSEEEITNSTGLRKIIKKLRDDNKAQELRERERDRRDKERDQREEERERKRLEDQVVLRSQLEKDIREEFYARNHKREAAEVQKGEYKFKSTAPALARVHKLRSMIEKSLITGLQGFPRLLHSPFHEELIDVLDELDRQESITKVAENSRHGFATVEKLTDESVGHKYVIGDELRKEVVAAEKQVDQDVKEAKARSRESRSRSPSARRPRKEGKGLGAVDKASILCHYCSKSFLYKKEVWWYVKS